MVFAGTDFWRPTAPSMLKAMLPRPSAFSFVGSPSLPLWFPSLAFPSFAFAPSTTTTSPAAAASSLSLCPTASPSAPPPPSPFPCPSPSPSPCPCLSPKWYSLRPFSPLWAHDHYHWRRGPRRCCCCSRCCERTSLPPYPHLRCCFAACPPPRPKTGLSATEKNIRKADNARRASRNRGGGRKPERAQRG